MLVSWLCSVFAEDHPLAQQLCPADLRVICVQFCTHLMAAGVVKRLEEEEDGWDVETAYIFKVCVVDTYRIQGDVIGKK